MLNILMLGLPERIGNKGYFRRVRAHQIHNLAGLGIPLRIDIGKKCLSYFIFKVGGY